MEIEKKLAIRDTKTVYKTGNKVIKLFNEDYSKADILNEALNLARVECTDLKIPRLLEVTKLGEKWGIVTEYIDGKNLEELINENPNKKDEYLDLFVNIQLEVLSKEAPPMLNRIKEKMRRKINGSDLSDSIKYEMNTRLDSMPNHYRICHGDFNPSNVIIKEDGTAYIIDWSHVTSGNRSADAARTFLVFSLNGQVEDAEKYLNLFEEKSGIPKSNVQKWIPIVAASQLSKGNKEEREFLMKWIDIIDY